MWADYRHNGRDSFDIDNTVDTYKSMYGMYGVEFHFQQDIKWV